MQVFAATIKFIFEALDIDMMTSRILARSYRWGASENCWYSYEADTCYSIEPNGEVLFGSRRWYEEDGPSDPCWPDDPEFQFISTEDFMAICRGLEPKLESEIEINPDALDLIL